MRVSEQGVGSFYSKLYRFPLVMVAVLSVGLSSTLSVIFWCSMVNGTISKILFGGCAAVFEFCKFFTLPEAMKFSSSSVKLLLCVVVYFLLTIVSIAGSVGGLQSSFITNQLKDTRLSATYIALTQEINAQQTALTTSLQAAHDAIAHQYRAQGREILENEIPRISEVINQLLERRNHLQAVTANPLSSFLIGLSRFYGNNHVAVAQTVFFIVVGTLIDVVASFLIFCVFSKTSYRKTYGVCGNKGYDSLPGWSTPGNSIQKYNFSINQTVSLSEEQGVFFSLQQNVPVEKQEERAQVEERTRQHLAPSDTVGLIKAGLLAGKFECSVRQIMRRGNVGYKGAMTIIQKLIESGIVRKTTKNRYEMMHGEG